MAWATGSAPWMEELYGRWPGYGTAMGIYGQNYLRPFQQYQASQVEPLSNLYDIAGRMGTAGGFAQYAPNTMFSQWAPGYAQNPQQMYGLAQQMMGSAYRMTPEQRATTGVTAGEGDLSNLLEMGLRTRLGRNTAGWLAGRIPSEQQAWTAQYPTGTGGPSFLDYVMNKYGLGRYF